MTRAKQEQRSLIAKEGSGGALLNKKLQKVKATSSSSLRRRLSKPTDTSKNTLFSRTRSLRKYRTGYLKYQFAFVLVGLFIATFCTSLLDTHDFTPISRRLSSDPDEQVVICNVTIIDDSELKDMGEFMDDVFTNSQRRNGAVMIHVVIMVYMFAALAIVCDTFFEASLERIVEEFKITNDVAGATWMAAGGSAPEFATSLIGALVTKSDIGFGTIVGSAVFNVLFVIGACAFVVGGGIKLTAYPLARDSIWYTCCLCAIVAVVADQIVYPLEALWLFGMYCLYILIMKYNSKLERWFKANMQKYSVKPGAATDTTDEEEKKEEKKEEEEEDEDFLGFPEENIDKIVHVVLLPLKLFMHVTIPDCGKKPKWYLVTFSMCVLHISIYSYVMVMMANTIGVTLRIPDEVMGVTVLAMGTSIPDALSSIAVARRGFGDMAVSSSIGSNIFDITMGLPVPWLLYIFKATYLSTNPEDKPYVFIHSNTMWLSVGTLLLMLISTVWSIHINKWRLNMKLGYMLLFLYLLFFIETLVLFFSKDCV